MRLIQLKFRRKESLTELAARNDIIISNIDEGEAVINQDIKDYLKEAEFNN